MTPTTATGGERTALFAPSKSYPNRLKDSHFHRATKRFADLTVAVLVIALVLIWMIPLIGLLIKLDSPGPVFFRQLRSGRGRKLFLCYKFRTMKHAPEQTFVQATGNDPRVTRFGDFLRRTSLDELPQFFNVLEGTMSVVGPRPHVPELDARFGKVVPDYFERNDMKPGVTGLAQIRGCRGETRTADDMADRIHLDRVYARRWSHWLDFKIVVWTAHDVVLHLKRSLHRPHPKSVVTPALKAMPWYNRASTRQRVEADADDNRWAS